MTIKTDALIIGAGPSGLFQIFELGLLGIKADIVDSLAQPGGQCTELYPDKPIYDIPGIPLCTGQEIVDNLIAQAEPFGATYHMGEELVELKQEEGGFHAVTHLGKEFHAKTVFVAGGVGSFQPRKMRLPEAAELDGTHVNYRVRDPSKFDGKRVVILGGGDSALDWAVDLAPRAASMTLVHRRDEFRGAHATVDALTNLAADGQAEIITSGTASALGVENGRLTSIDIKLANDEVRTLEADELLVFFGLSPKLGPIAEWGLDINRKTINVDTEKFETNVPGIFAIGDINTYENKLKLILCGFHEAALMAHSAAHIVYPDKKIRLKYTTVQGVEEF